jgi:hypothetical protein
MKNPQTQKLSRYFWKRPETIPKPITEDSSDEDSDEPSNPEDTREFIKTCEPLSTSHQHLKMSTALGACVENYRKAGTRFGYPMLEAAWELLNSL